MVNSPTMLRTLSIDMGPLWTPPAVDKHKIWWVSRTMGAYKV